MSWRVRRARQSDAGFTLIEVMLSMAILASMAALVWSSFSLTSRGRRRAEEISDRYHQIRLAMNRMSREISMAFLSKNQLFNQIVPRTLFVSERNSRVDQLTFSALSHVRIEENAKESDQCVIRYFSARDPENSGQTNLMRREEKRLGGQRPGEEGPAYVMLEDVESLHFEFYDARQDQWRERWTTRAADGQPDRLPTKVRIHLKVRNEKDKEVTFYTATRVFLTNPLWFSGQ